MFQVIKSTLTVSAIALLAACGGDSANPAASGTAEGFWSGTASNGNSVGIFVLENSETWGIYTRNGFIQGALFGTSTGTGSNFSASGTDFNLLQWSSSVGSYTGSVVPKSTINAVSNLGVSISLAYDADYEQAASLQAVAGNYSLSGVSAFGGGTNIPFIISAQGVANAGQDGCSASGTVLPRPGGKNVYNISLTFSSSGGNCAFGNGATASGIFLLDTTVIPNAVVTLALTPNKQDGFIGVGEKLTIRP
jgi:hypothetical protein